MPRLWGVVLAVRGRRWWAPRAARVVRWSVRCSRRSAFESPALEWGLRTARGALRRALERRGLSLRPLCFVARVQLRWARTGLLAVGPPSQLTTPHTRHTSVGGQSTDVSTCSIEGGGLRTHCNLGRCRVGRQGLELSNRRSSRIRKSSSVLLL